MSSSLSSPSSSPSSLLSSLSSCFGTSFLWYIGTVLLMVVIVFLNSEDDQVMTMQTSRDFMGIHLKNQNQLQQQQQQQQKQQQQQLFEQDQDFVTRIHADADGRDSDQKPILQISILAERHTGGDQLYQLVQDCFGHALKIHPNLTRGMHWFQHTNATRYEHNTLVLALFLNPYHWFEAIRQKPDYCGESFPPNQKWHPFIARDWTSNKLLADAISQQQQQQQQKKKKKNFKNNKQQQPECQQDFRPDQILPCQQQQQQPNDKDKDKDKDKHHHHHQRPLSKQDPFFELNPNGSLFPSTKYPPTQQTQTQTKLQPFDNIMHLRTAKIRNWLFDIPQMAGIAGLWTIQAEYLQQQQTGIQSLIQKIQQQTGHTAQCKNNDAIQKFKSNPLPKFDPDTANDYFMFLNRHIEWSTEGLIGYVQWDITPPVNPNAPTDNEPDEQEITSDDQIVDL